MSRLQPIVDWLTRRSRSRAQEIMADAPERERLPRSLWRPWYPWAILLVLISSGVAYWFIQRPAVSEANTEQIYAVERGSIMATISPTGEVYTPRSSELSFDVTKVELVELNVEPGNTVKEGEVLARIDPSPLERAVTQAEADLVLAQDDLEKVKTPYDELDIISARLAVTQSLISLTEAQDELDQLLNPDLEAAQQAVSDAAISLKNARQSLTSLENDTSTTSRIRTLEYEATWFKNNYWAAQKKFEEGKIDQLKLDFEYSNMLSAGEKLRKAQVDAESSLQSAQQQVTKAQTAYDSAVEDLEKLEAGPDELDLTRAQTKVAQAEYSLARSQEDLQEILDGPSAHDIEVAEAKVLSAKAGLDEARVALYGAEMYAPFNGTVVSVNAAVGDQVSSGTTVITLADLSNLRVMAIIDESEIAQVEIGQDVTITFDAFAGMRFSGQVLEVPLQGTLSQNILTYEVPISLEDGREVSLKPGMTANLAIMVGRSRDVPVLPVLAIREGEQGPTAMRRDTTTGAVKQQPVELGLSDGTRVEIRSGLVEGDQVVVDYAVSQPQQTFGGNQGGFSPMQGPMIRGGGGR